MRNRRKLEKIIAVILCMGMTAAAAGCSESGTKEISGDVKNNVVSGGSQDGDAAAETDDGASESEGGSGEAAAFSYNGTQITIDAEAADILEALGDPASKYESPSCAFGDLDVIYTYSGFEVDTYQIDGVDYISAVLLLDDSVETPEGLYIGADEENVEALYGEPTEENEDSMTYSYETMKFVVILENGKVDSIQYLTLEL